MVANRAAGEEDVVARKPVTQAEENGAVHDLLGESSRKYYITTRETRLSISVPFCHVCLYITFDGQLVESRVWPL